MKTRGCRRIRPILCILLAIGVTTGCSSGSGGSGDGGERAEPIDLVLEAHIDGDTEGTPGVPITLDGNNSGHPAATISEYAWELNGDGAFDDALGRTIQFTPMSSGAYRLGLRITDGDGHQAIAWHTVRVMARSPALAFRRAPSTREIAGVRFSFLVVEIQDGAGNRVAQDQQTRVTIEPVGGQGRLEGTLTRRARDGWAVFDDLSYDRPEAIRIQATAQDLESVTSSKITIAEPLPSGLTIERLSLSAAETEARGASGGPALSADGRFAGFYSAAALVEGDTNGLEDVFVRDRFTTDLGWASHTLAGEATSGAADEPSLSANGRFVVFTSEAPELPGAPPSGGRQVYSLDRQSGELVRLSTTSSGAGTGNRGQIDASGRYVIFRSSQPLVPEDTNNLTDWYRFDQARGTLQRVTVATGGGEAHGGSWDASMAAEAPVIAFASDANDLVASDTNAQLDVFVRDLASGVTERISLAEDGGEANGPSVWPVLSADGRYVAYWSLADNLVSGDGNGRGDVFVYDRQTGETERVSLGAHGVEGDGHSQQPSISAGGRFVAFVSAASNLTPGDTNGLDDIFVHDRQSGQLARISVSSEGQQALGQSMHPVIGANGNYLAFESDAPNLVGDDTNGQSDVFVAPNPFAE